MTVSDNVHQLEEDFLERNPPFDEVIFPEERLIETLPSETMEEQAILSSIFASFDYNRNANQLVDNLIELYDRDRTWFVASVVAEIDEEVLQEELEEIGFRYPSRDAHAWVVNCGILREKYNSKWTELLLSVGTDAPTLVDRLHNDEFLVMKGVKIAPMYARIINDFVVPLDNMWKVDIPVDTHVRRLSRDLFDDPDMSDDEIRAKWRDLSEETGIDRQVVDGALWHIGNKWDDWGQEYWQDLE